MAAEKYTECWLWAALLRPSPWLMVCWFSGRLLKSFSTMLARSEISLPSGFSALGMGNGVTFSLPSLSVSTLASNCNSLAGLDFKSINMPASDKNTTRSDVAANKPVLPW